nr:DUF3298 and DUF4163 domain-containing protein [Allomuricauda sp.]
MKKLFFALLTLLMCLGCETDHKLTFEPHQVSEQTCENCPNIQIEIVKAMDGSSLGKTINNSVEEEIIALLSFDDAEGVDSMSKAIASFSKSFQELQEKFPDETVGWEAKIDCEVAYEDENILTLILGAYTFTGGAHGYSSTTYLNFDKVKAEEMDNWELFDDEEGFTNYAETKFRIQEAIPQDDNINATGFMFEGDVFHLSDAMGYTPDGLQLIYNQYEIASYADGPKVLTIPFAEANKYLKRPVAQ